jgi:hypothetical protein
MNSSQGQFLKGSGRGEFGCSSFGEVVKMVGVVVVLV